MTRFGAGLLLAVSLGLSAHAADRSEIKLAYLQPTNIFHSGLKGSHTLALTFDDGPALASRDMVAALRENNVTATFFIVGNMARIHPDILREIAYAGHLLGNHTATHPRLSAAYARKPELLLNQLRQVDRIIDPLMNIADVRFFRAPYGVWQPSQARIVNADKVLKNYVGPIYWDVGGQTRVDKRGYIVTAADWDCWRRGWKVSTCAKGYMREIEAKDGGVVLIHAVNEKSADLVRQLIPALKREGFRFVRLDEVRTYDQYKTPPEQPMTLAQLGAFPVLRGAEPR